MLAWLPIIGPIIEGIVSVFAKAKDTQVAIKKLEGEQEAVIIKSSQETVRDFSDQTDIRIARDIVLFPICTWTGLIVWDKIVEIKFPWLVWGVLPIKEDTGIAFLPYAAMVFLLGYAGIAAFKRR